MRRIFSMVVASFVALVSLGATPAGAIDPTDTSVTCDGLGGHTARLYRTLLGRPADLAGLGYWIEEQRRGLGLHGAAYWMTQGIEFRTRYGHLSDGQYVDAMYHNVLGRPADPEGRAYWLDEMTRIGRHGVATWITLSEEMGSRDPLRLSPICPKVRVLGLDEVKPGVAVGRTGSTVTVIADRAIVEFRAVDGPWTYAIYVPGDVVVNANWFDDVHTLGPVVSNGVRTGTADLVERGQLVAYRPGCGDHGTGELAHIWQGVLAEPGPCVAQAVSGVSLIHHGVRADAFPGITFSGYTSTSLAHSFIGFSETELVVISTREMNASTLADYALSLGVVEGVMLDGGGSTQISTPTERLWSSRAVPAFATLTSRATG